MTLDEHIHKAEEDAKMAEFDTVWGMGNYFIDRTEALEYAKECRQLAEWLKDYKRLLEQEPSGDLISRQQTKAYLYDRIERLNDDELYDIFSKIIDDMVNELPSVKPQERTGHWIIMGDRYIKCSECGHITKTESPDIYNFCMVCGANMSEIPTSSKPEISSFYGLRSYVGERSDKE